METKNINGSIYEKTKGGWKLQGALAEPRSFAQEMVPTLGAIGGGIVGGVVGLAAGGVGAIPGAITGAVVGGAGGEALQQKIEKSYGQRQKFDPAQIATTGVTAGLLQATGAGIAKGIGSAAQAIRPSMARLMGKLSGYADDVVTKALERTPGVVSAVKQGEKALNDIVIRANTKIQELASIGVKEAQKKVAEFNKLSGGDAGNPGIRRIILKEGSNFVGNITTKLRKAYNIGVDNVGTLNFNREKLPSNIVSGSDQSAIRDAFTTLSKIKNDTSIKNIDTIFERLVILKTKTPGGTPTGGETKKIIGNMLEELQKFVQKSEKFGKGYSDYYTHLQENLPKRVMMEEMKDLFGTSRYLSPTETAQISQKLLRLFNTGQLPIKEAVAQVSTKTGEDIVGGVAGTLIKTGKQPSVDVTLPAVRNVIQKIVEFVPRGAVKNYVSTGKLTGELLNNPYIIRVSKTLGISTKAVIIQIVNLTQNKTIN